MSEKAKKAVENHHNGYNCAQSVACAFAEELGYSEGEVFALTEAFGFGMGCMNVCGAVSGMTAVAGMKESSGEPGNSSTKKAGYKAAKAMVNAFTEKNGSIVCADLKGIGTGKVLRDCDGCVEDAAEIVEKYLKGEL